MSEYTFRDGNTYCDLSSSQQRELYDETFRVTVDSVLEGYNGMLHYMFSILMSHYVSMLLLLQELYLHTDKPEQERHLQWKVHIIRPMCTIHICIIQCFCWKF